MKAIEKAAYIIQHDGVISYPTESVFGLGCDPMSEIAVNRILKLKQRSVEKGLIVIAANIRQLSPYIEISSTEEKKILSASSPTTWLVTKSNATPSWVCGKHKKIAIRISQHPLVIKLCHFLDQAIISTSANPAGAVPALNNQQSQHYFSEQVDFYLNSEYPTSDQPTTIKDIQTGAIIR